MNANSQASRKSAWHPKQQGSRLWSSGRSWESDQESPKSSLRRWRPCLRGRFDKISVRTVSRLLLEGGPTHQTGPRAARHRSRTRRREVEVVGSAANHNTLTISPSFLPTTNSREISSRPDLPCTPEAQQTPPPHSSTLPSPTDQPAGWSGCSSQTTEEPRWTSYTCNTSTWLHPR